MHLLKHILKTQSDYKKFIILSRPRTGSTLLTKMLLSHPNVKGSCEPLNKLKGRNPQKILDDLFVPYRPKVKAVGFKLHYNHPVDEDHHKTWRILLDDKTYHIIHLERKNHLRTCVSELISQKLAIYLLRNKNKRPPIEDRKVIVTYNEFLEWVDINNMHYNSYSAMFSDHKKIEIEYERLVNSPVDELNRIAGYLSLAEFTPKHKLVQMNPEPLSELIVNFDELKDKLKDSEHAWMLDS